MQEKLGIGDLQSFKAASALAGGVARQGETCGALLASIMAIGLVVGREKLEDVEQYRESLVPSIEMYRRFRDELGSTICAEIQKKKLGRSFELWRPEEMDAFNQAGGHNPDACPDVCARAARIAAEIILRLQAENG